MAGESLYLSFLLAGGLGFMDNMYVQLQDCCKYKQQGIVFCIDRENQDYTISKQSEFVLMSPISSLLFGAIVSNNGFPIIASKSSVITLFNLLNSYAQTHEKLKALKDVIVKAFVIKEVDDFYILIPNGAQIKGINNNLTTVKSVPSEMPSSWFPFYQTNTPINQICEKIFASYKEAPDVSWMIYLVGHGYPEKAIGGLTISEFKQFINFINGKINTKIFLYTSCYAGGENKIKGFEIKNQQLIQQTFPFPVILFSIGDIPVRAPNHLNFLEIAPPNFADLFSKLSKDIKGPQDYYTILLNANFFKIKSNQSDEEVLNITGFPQIRLPGTESFSIESLSALERHPEYVVISKVQGKARDNDLKIKENTKLVFLYTPIIPFKVIIPQANYSLRFINADHLLHDYHFAFLEAPSLSYIDLCKRFAPLMGRTPSLTSKEMKFSYKDEKITYYIDTLVYKDQELYNCEWQIFSDSKDNAVYFKLTGNTKDNKTMHIHTKTKSDLLLSLDMNNVTFEEPAIKQVSYLEKKTPQSLSFDTVGKELSQVVGKRAQTASMMPKSS